jgi:hypothetical protein
MKELLLTLIISLSFVTFNVAQAQKEKKKSNEDAVAYEYLQKDSATDKFKYEEVIIAEGISQADIYKRAKGLILRNFKSSDNLTQLDDENISSIIATPTIIIDEYDLTFKLIIYCKEGRCKVVIESFVARTTVYGSGEDDAMTFEGPLENSAKLFGKKKSEKLLMSISENNKKIIADLKSVIVNNKAGDQGDW